MHTITVGVGERKTRKLWAPRSRVFVFGGLMLLLFLGVVKFIQHNEERQFQAYALSQQDNIRETVIRAVIAETTLRMRKYTASTLAARYLAPKQIFVAFRNTQDPNNTYLEDPDDRFLKRFKNNVTKVEKSSQTSRQRGFSGTARRFFITLDEIKWSRPNLARVQVNFSGRGKIYTVGKTEKGWAVTHVEMSWIA